MPLPRPSRSPKKEETTLAEPGKPLEKKDFRPSDVFRFDPKSDITAEELGYLISVFWTLDVNYDRFFSFQTDMQRHFRPVK